MTSVNIYVLFLCVLIVVLLAIIVYLLYKIGEWEKTPVSSIANLVTYNMADEYEDYVRAIRDGDIEPGEKSHVFTDIFAIHKWLENK